MGEFDEQQSSFLPKGNRRLEEMLSRSYNRGAFSTQPKDQTIYSYEKEDAPGGNHHSAEAPLWFGDRPSENGSVIVFRDPDQNVVGANVLDEKGRLKQVFWQGSTYGTELKGEQRILLDADAKPVTVKNGKIYDSEGRLLRIPTAAPFTDAEGTVTVPTRMKYKAEEFDTVNERYSARTLANGKIQLRVVREFQKDHDLNFWRMFGDVRARTFETRVYNPDDKVPVLGADSKVRMVPAKDLTSGLKELSNYVCQDAPKLGSALFDAALMSRFRLASSLVSGGKYGWGAVEAGRGLLGLSGLLEPAARLGELGQVGGYLPHVRSALMLYDLYSGVCPRGPLSLTRFLGKAPEVAVSSMVHAAEIGALALMFPAFGIHNYETVSQLARKITSWCSSSEKAVGTKSRESVNGERIGNKF